MKIILEVLLLAVALAVELTLAQYEGDGYEAAASQGGYSSYGGYGGYGDERPKIHLGLRVKIPAFKFELPRFSLPRVTISAKIKQPEGPRVIRLPEINLDTSSKVAAPTGSTSGGDQYGGNYGAGAYGGHGSAQTNTFTFSTGGDEHSSYGNQHQYHQQSRPQMTHYSSPRQNQHLQQYGATESHPTYWDSHSFTGAQVHSQHTPEPNPDVGFSQPVYLDASRSPHRQELGQGDRGRSADHHAQESAEPSESLPVRAATEKRQVIAHRLRAQQIAAQLESGNMLIAPREYRRPSVA